MKSLACLMLLCATALLAGCASPGGDICVINRPLRFGSMATIDWLMAHDRPLLSATVAHNETLKRLCNL